MNISAHYYGLFFLSLLSSLPFTTSPSHSLFPSFPLLFHFSFCLPPSLSFTISPNNTLSPFLFLPPSPSLPPPLPLSPSLSSGCPQASCR